MINRSGSHNTHHGNPLSSSMSPFDGYQENSFKPQPATQRRDTDKCSLDDIGGKTCCMGLTQPHALGLTRNDLHVPVLNLRAAIKRGINILGVVFLMISGYDRHAKMTHQVVLVSEDVEPLILSWEVCAQFSMIFGTFLEVGSHMTRDVFSNGVEAGEKVLATNMVLLDEDMDLTQ